MTRIPSSTWTGRPPWAGSPVAVACRALQHFLYPVFDCTDCIGMIEHGCQCDYYGAIAPGVPPEPWHTWLRNLIGRRLWSTGW